MKYTERVVHTQLMICAEYNDVGLDMSPAFIVSDDE